MWTKISNAGRSDYDVHNSGALFFVSADGGNPRRLNVTKQQNAKPNKHTYDQGINLTPFEMELAPLEPASVRWSSLTDNEERDSNRSRYPTTLRSPMEGRGITKLWRVGSEGC